MLDDDVDDTVIRPRRDAAAHPSAGTDDTILRPRRSAAAAAAAAAAADAPDASGVGAADAVADTVIRAVRAPAPPSAPRSPSAPAPAPAWGQAPRAADAPGAPWVPPVPTTPERRIPSIRFRERVVSLDQPVVLGRRPVGSRIPRGPEPLMVTVPSPTGQVSGTHVTIRAEGTAVVVEDMRSTNGTFVRVPGAPPLRMRAGAAMVVLTGTVVDIGDGNVIEILSPHLRLRPSDPGPGTGFPAVSFPTAGFPDVERPTP